MTSFHSWQLITVIVILLISLINAQTHITVNSSSLNYIGVVSDSADELEWIEAQAYCKSNFGTSLATVQSSDEWDEIYALASYINTIPNPHGDGSYLYIGFRSNSNGNLVWAPCYDTNNDCTYDPCEANCDVYADDWTGKGREGAYNTNGCGYIIRSGATKTWYDGGCTGNRDFICNSPYGKYKTDINCQDTGLKDSEYTMEPGMDIQCGLENHFPRPTNDPIIHLNSSSFNYVGIVQRESDELGWYYAQTYCKVTYGTSLATIQNSEEWNEIWNLAETIDGLSGSQSDGLYLWIGFKSTINDNLVWAPCHDSIYETCTYDPCEANCDAYADNWTGKDREATFDTNLCGRIQRGSANKIWADENCNTKRDFICNSPYGKYKTDISCVDTGLLDNEFSDKSPWDVSCKNPSTSPTKVPTNSPLTSAPTIDPTIAPSIPPTNAPSVTPSLSPTFAPTLNPSISPSYSPTQPPSNAPSFSPTISPTKSPFVPGEPTISPTNPTNQPTHTPTKNPTNDPTIEPTIYPTHDPTNDPTYDPTTDPTNDPTFDPTTDPTIDPTYDPTTDPTIDPTTDPTYDPSIDPTIDPTKNPTIYPTTPTSPPTLPEGQVGTTDYSNDKGKGLTDNNNQSFLEKNLLLLIIAGAAVLLCCVTVCIIIMLKKNKNKNGIADLKSIELGRVTSASTREGPSENGDTLKTTLTVEITSPTTGSGETMQNAETPVIPNDKININNIEPFSNEYQIKIWLENIGLIQYFELFISNGFGDGTEALMDVTNEDLREMGIHKVAHRKLILKQIRNNNQQMNTIVQNSSGGGVIGEINDDDDKTDEDKTDEDEMYGGNNIGQTDNGYNDNNNDENVENNDYDNEQGNEDSVDNIMYQKPLKQTDNGYNDKNNENNDNEQGDEDSVDNMMYQKPLKQTKNGDT